MAYNFSCETAVEPNWKKLNNMLMKYDCLEAYPMSESEKDCFCLSISIPMKHIGERAYGQFVSAYSRLTKKYGFTVYDMYYGKEVDEEHIKLLRKELV